MATKQTSGELRLKKVDEANSFATDFIQALQRLSLSNESITPDEVAASVRAGLPLFKDNLPTASENTPPFLLDLLGPLIGPKREKSSVDAFLKEYQRVLANPPKTGKDFHDSIARDYLSASPAGVSVRLQFLQKLKSLAANPLMVRDQLIGALKKNMRGTPGPKNKTGRDLDLIIQSSEKLLPVCQKVFDLFKGSKQPLPEIIKAVSTLHPEWKDECEFLLANEELVNRSMHLAKIRRAKTRGKATMLAAALACRFAGYDDAPSYSMQLVEQARRSVKY